MRASVEGRAASYRGNALVLFCMVAYGFFSAFLAALLAYTMLELGITGVVVLIPTACYLAIAFLIAVVVAEAI